MPENNVNNNENNEQANNEQTTVWGNRISEQIGGSSYEGNRQTTAYNYTTMNRGDYDTTGAWQSVDGVWSGRPHWGESASRSLYSVFANQNDDLMKNRDLLTSRLWHGVPQLTEEQMNMFEAAYTGHTFLFVVNVPTFMTKGMYENTNLHYQMKNLKAVIERASTGFSGPSNITADFSDMDDGAMRKVSHVTRVTKEQSDIQLRLHEFAGLPVKNALEAWLTGTYDPKSQHGHYFGNLGIPGGWCLSNHTMSLLVVQVDPSWQVIQDAAYYYNMFPQDVPFDHFEWTKGEHDIVQDYTITFKCNEERSPMIMYAAERYMNNRILTMVATSVYNSREFVVSSFTDGDGTPLDYQGFSGLMENTNPTKHYGFIDRRQYNMQYANSNFSSETSGEETVSNNWTETSIIGDGRIHKDAKLSIIKDRGKAIDHINDSGHYMHGHDNNDGTTETYAPWSGNAPVSVTTTTTTEASASGTT